MCRSVSVNGTKVDDTKTLSEMLGVPVILSPWCSWQPNPDGECLCHCDVPAMANAAGKTCEASLSSLVDWVITSAVIPRLVAVDYGCDLCHESRCTVHTQADPPFHGCDGDRVTCNYCLAEGYMVCNGLKNDDGSEGYDVVWIDPETGEDYRW